MPTLLLSIHILVLLRRRHTAQHRFVHQPISDTDTAKTDTLGIRMMIGFSMGLHSEGGTAVQRLREAKRGRGARGQRTYYLA